MNQFTGYARWHFIRFWDQLTFGQVILMTSIVALLGIWLWLVPAHRQQLALLQRDLDTASTTLDSIPRQPSQPAISAQKNRSALQYEDFLPLLSSTDVTLLQFGQRDGLNQQDQFELVTHGSWYGSRILLSALESDIGLQLISCQIKRDPNSNLITMSLVLRSTV